MYIYMYIKDVWDIRTSIHAKNKALESHATQVLRLDRSVDKASRNSTILWVL